MPLLLLLANKMQFEQCLEFTNPSNGNTDVLEDFDFDSFLHNDGDGVDQFSFDATNSLDGREFNVTLRQNAKVLMI